MPRLWSFPGRHLQGSLLLAAALLYGVRLGATDFVEWDEAFYASRALVALREGAWLDQSAHAIGGLWTGAHPPLVVWTMALSAMLLGANEWALRLPAALAGVACVMVVVRFGLLLSAPPGAWWSGAALLAVPLFTRYTRMAQLDSAVLLWTTLALFCFARGIGLQRVASDPVAPTATGSAEARPAAAAAGLGRPSPIWHFLAAGLALGLGLMSKILVAFLAPMVVVAWIVWEALRGSRTATGRALIGLVIVVAVGLLVALPWHLAMTTRLGADYWRQSLGYHVVARMARPLEGHESHLGALYWPFEIVKRLGPLFPVAVLGMLAPRDARSLSPAAWRFVWCWLLVPLALFSLTATKFHPYLLSFLPPLALFTGIGIVRLASGRVSRKATAWVAAGAVASVVWGQTDPLHRALERIAGAVRQLEVPAAGDLGAAAGFAALAIGLGAIAARAAVRMREDLWRRTRAWGMALTVALPAGVLALGPVFSGGSDWIELRAFVARSAPRRVVYQARDTAVDRFYLAMLGTAKGRAFRPPTVSLGSTPSSRVPVERGTLWILPADSVGVGRDGARIVFANGSFVALSAE